MLLDKCSFLDPRLCGTEYAMDKDEVICQLKQETVVVLESEDEKASNNYLVEKLEDSQHPKKDSVQFCTTVWGHSLAKEAISSVPCGTDYQVSMLTC